jgi:hypothetical protein
MQTVLRNVPEHFDLLIQILKKNGKTKRDR